MILAAEKGRVGERYLISEKMITNAEVARIAAEAAGVAPPAKSIPLAVSYALAAMGTRQGAAARNRRAALAGVAAADACRSAGRLLRRPGANWVGSQGRSRIRSARRRGSGWACGKPSARASRPAERRAAGRSGFRRVAAAGLASTDVTEKLHVDLSGAPQTMLATFYAKALDADLEKPILGDRWAKDIVDRIDYDWSKTTITARNSPAVTTRSRALRRLGAAVPGSASRGVGAAPGLRPGQQVLPARPRARRRVVRRRLSRCRRTAQAAVPGAGALPRRRGIRHRPGLARRRTRRPADADDRRGPDDVPHRGRRRRAAAPDRRPRAVG